MLITHGIGMLFNIASMLNDPFGFDVHDIKLNRIYAVEALSLLDMHMNGAVNHEYLVDESHDTPAWLEDEYAQHVAEKNDGDGDVDDRVTDKKGGTAPQTKTSNKQQTSGDGKKRRGSMVSSFLSWKPELFVPMDVLLAWCCFVVSFGVSHATMCAPKATGGGTSTSHSTHELPVMSPSAFPPARFLDERRLQPVLDGDRSLEIAHSVLYERHHAVNADDPSRRFVPRTRSRAFPLLHFRATVRREAAATFPH